MTLTQQQFKDLKQEVVDQSALGVGYFENILEAIPTYALLDAIRDLGDNGWIKATMSDGELLNLLVSESIRSMNYQDFKTVAPYLFSYPKEQREDFFYAQPVTVSREVYEWLQAQSDELFRLKTEVEATRENLEMKIEELETDRLPNGDQVIGLDQKARELLLLRSPETSYIDDWRIEREGLLYDYRQPDNYATQALSYLTATYPEVKQLVREAVLDRDKIDNAIIVDDELLPPETSHLLPSFNTHRDYYNYGQGFSDFKEAFPNYDTYINTIYERHYPTNYGQDFWAMWLLPKYQTAINEQLALHGKELMTYTVGDEEANDNYYLSYLRDLKTETVKEVEDYLEHQVGAYLRGSLGELVMIKLDHIDRERGYDGKGEKTLFVDHYQLWHHREGNLKTVQSLYPQLSRFVPIEQVQKREYDKETRQSSPGLNI